MHAGSEGSTLVGSTSRGGSGSKGFEIKIKGGEPREGLGSDSSAARPEWMPIGTIAGAERGTECLRHSMTCLLKSLR